MASSRDRRAAAAGFGQKEAKRSRKRRREAIMGALRGGWRLDSSRSEDSARSRPQAVVEVQDPERARAFVDHDEGRDGAARMLFHLADGGGDAQVDGHRRGIA